MYESVLRWSYLNPIQSHHDLFNIMRNSTSYDILLLSSLFIRINTQFDHHILYSPSEYLYRWIDSMMLHSIHQISILISPIPSSPIHSRYHTAHHLDRFITIPSAPSVHSIMIRSLHLISMTQSGPVSLLYLLVHTIIHSTALFICINIDQSRPYQDHLTETD